MQPLIYLLLHRRHSFIKLFTEIARTISLGNTFLKDETTKIDNQSSTNQSLHK